MQASSSTLPSPLRYPFVPAKYAAKKLFQLQQQKQNSAIQHAQIIPLSYNCNFYSYQIALKTYNFYETRSDAHCKYALQIMCTNSDCQACNIRMFACIACFTTVKSISSLCKHFASHLDDPPLSECSICKLQYSHRNKERLASEIIDHVLFAHLKTTLITRQQQNACINEISVSHILIPLDTSELVQDQVWNDQFHDTNDTVDISNITSVIREMPHNSFARLQIAVTNLDEYPAIALPVKCQSLFTPYFSTKWQFEFAIHDFILNDLSENQAKQILSHFQNYCESHIELRQDMYNSFYEVTKSFTNLPKLPVHSIPFGEYVSLHDRIANVMNTEELLQYMHFDTSTQYCSAQYPISQFYETEVFASICSQCEPDVIPIVVGLYYDEFRKFRHAPGSTGGLYFTFLNFERHVYSKPKNIFCYSLCKSEVAYYFALQQFIQELEVLNNIHTVYCASVKKRVKIRVALALITADMPQRHMNCSVMAPISDNGCCCTCMCTSNDLIKAPREYDAQNGINIKNYRTVPLSQKLQSKYSEYTTKTQQDQFGKKYGFKPFMPNMPNPFWKLQSLAFHPVDVHQISIVDYFHVEILGLARKHFKLLINEILTPDQRNELERACAKYKVGNRKLLPLSTYKYWNGDQWLRLFAISAFVLYPIMHKSNNATMIEHYQCWLDHLNWMFIMMQPSLSVADIAVGEQMCWKWRATMVKLFQHINKLKLPNFHAILHIFDQARLFGPPILYWTRPFEHKHAIFRHYIDNSNKKNIEQFCLKRDTLIESILYLFPFIKDRSPYRYAKSRTLAINDYVLFYLPNTKLRQYGQIRQIDNGKVKLIHFLRSDKTQCHSVHKCLLLATMNKVEIDVEAKQIYGRFSLVHGFINRFEVFDQCYL